MILASSTPVTMISREVLPPSTWIAVTAKFSVTTDTAEDTVDLTDELRGLVAGSGVTEGTLHLYCGHTTCGFVINEDDAGLDTDTREALERIAPHPSNHYYAHDKLRTPAERLLHGERDNGHSHIRAMIATQLVSRAYGGVGGDISVKECPTASIQMLVTADNSPVPAIQMLSARHTIDLSDLDWRIPKRFDTLSITFRRLDTNPCTARIEWHNPNLTLDQVFNFRGHFG